MRIYNSPAAQEISTAFRNSDGDFGVYPKTQCYSADWFWYFEPKLGLHDIILGELG